MKLNRLTKWLLLFSIICACNNLKSDKVCPDPKSGNIRLRHISELAIELDTLAADLHSNLQIKNINGIHYLFRLNDYTEEIPQSLEIINITERKFERRIRYPFEGNSGFNNIINFYVHNFDSIILHSEYPLSFYWTDTAGSYQNKIDVAQSKDVAAKWRTENKAYFEPKNGLIYFNSMSVRYFYPTNQDEFLSKPYLSSISSHAEIKAISNNYPELYKEAAKEGKYFPWLDNPIYLWNKGNLYLSFPTYDRVYKIDNQSLMELCANSVFFQKPEPIPEDIDEFSVLLNYNNEVSRFCHFIFDPYRNMMIRVLKHAQEKYKANGQLNTFFDADFSLIFFNDHGKIGEIKLEKNKYNPMLIIPTKNGVLLNKDNPNNPTNDEDLLEFDLLDIQVINNFK